MFRHPQRKPVANLFTFVIKNARLNPDQTSPDLLRTEIKKIQERNGFASDGIDDLFCQELKTLLKQTIDVWNGYHKGQMPWKIWFKEKERVIPRIIELLSLPIEHKDSRRVRKRIIKHNQELFIFLDNPLIEPMNNRA